MGSLFPSPGDLPHTGIKPGHTLQAVLATWEAQYSGQFISVPQSYLTICHPMDCKMPGSLFITNSQSLLKLMSIQLVMTSNHLILCRPLLLSPSIFPSIKGFSKESVPCIRWSKYWSFSFSISPSNEYSGVSYVSYINKLTIFSLDVLLYQLGTSLLFHVQF